MIVLAGEMAEPGGCVAEDNGCQQQPGLTEGERAEQAEHRETRAEIVPGAGGRLGMLAQIMRPELRIPGDSRTGHRRLVNCCNAWGSWWSCNRSRNAAPRP